MTPLPPPGKKKTWLLIILACYVYVHYFQTPERPTGGELELKNAEKQLRRRRQSGMLIRRKQRQRQAERGKCKRVVF